MASAAAAGAHEATAPEPRRVEPAQPLAAFYRRWAGVAGLVVVGLSAVVLLGWILGIPLLTRLLPQFLPMEVGTAVCLLLGGAALYSLGERKPGKGIRLAVRTAAAVLVAVGTLVFLQFLTGVPGSLGGLLSGGAIRGPDGSFSGAMAPNTAFILALIGAAFLLLSSDRRIVLAQALVLFSGVVSLLAVLGYLYRIEALYGAAFHAYMAPHTALALVLLSAGGLFLRTDRGLMTIFASETAGGLVARRLLPAVILVPSLLGWLSVTGVRAGAYNASYAWALFTALSITSIALIVWDSARALHRVDEDRLEAEREIARLNRDLQRRVDELQTMFEVAPVGIGIAQDRTCRVISANTAFASILGVEPGTNTSLTGPEADELPFRVMRDGREIPPTDLPIQRAAANNEIIRDLEYDIVRREGGVVTLLEYAAPLHDERGQVRGALGVFVDITEMKRTEAELRQQKHVLETINRINTSLAAELDLEKLVQAVTDAGTELSGAQFGAFFYNVLDEQGERFMLCTLSGAPREAFERFPMPRNTAIFHPTFAGEGVVRIDDVTKDPRFGKNLPYHGMPEGHLPVRSYLAVPVSSRTGEVLGGLFFGHEQVGVFDEYAEQIVTAIADQAAIAVENARLFTAARIELKERERAERQLKELNETLEQRVAERTVELEHANALLKAEVGERARAEDALEKTNAALVRSNRELQEFAYVASHDLQAPLRKIHAFADLLADSYDGELDEERALYLDRIRASAARMSQFIHDLLSFSRVSTRIQPFEPIALSGVAEEVLSDLEVQISEQEGRVEVGELPTIEADPTQMRQLFQNLIGNALKFRRPEVPPVVRVDARLEEDGAVCRLTFADNGIGFEEQYTDRIFSPFQRLHGRDAYPGTGMGLAICRRIVERHGGSIEASSSPDEGSTFTVRLPVKNAAAAQPTA